MTELNLKKTVFRVCVYYEQCFYYSSTGLGKPESLQGGKCKTGTRENLRRPGCIYGKFNH